MKEYAQLAQKSKDAITGLYNLQYGLARRETLDIFPAKKQPSPIFIYIHGGYWRAQSKDDACSMAENFVAHGIAVSTIEYSLCPHASLFEIVREVRTAIAWIYQNAKTYGIDPEQIYVGGSSAGGHLVAMLWSDRWQEEFNLPKNVIKGVLGLSGLYNLLPLCDTNINEWLKLSPEQATELSPYENLPLPENAAPLLLSVGELETQGFHNQTNFFYSICKEKDLAVSLIKDEGHNHFDIVNT
ncbi:alpha/beta hydrolase fold domain-containing protein, partial [Acinetobacter baumannii]|nr:alpha/beta hydrolase fold domain-containing protein [Acinetobacter baumannii]